MTAIRGPLARLERSREELAKGWLVRVIERASLDDIRDLPTERIARELPDVISDLLGACAGDGDAGELTEEQVERAASLAALRAGREAAEPELARDLAALQTVLVRALRAELAEADPLEFATAAERLAEAIGAVQVAAMSELIRAREGGVAADVSSDPLTGLWNVRHLEREIGHLLDLHKRYDHRFGLLVLDVEGLRRVNDAHGPQTGDRVLVQIATSLRRSIRVVDTAARLGGDEFCVLLPHQDAAGAAALGRRVAASTRDEFLTPEAPSVRVAVGVVVCPDHGTSMDALLEAADAALYRAKAAGEPVAVGNGAATDLAERAKS